MAHEKTGDVMERPIMSTKDLDRRTNARIIADGGTRLVTYRPLWERTPAIILQRLCGAIWNATVAKSEFGLLPKEYNKKVHGYYFPFRYYGKPDPIGDVKLSELPGWLARRPKGITPLARLFSRAIWRWRWNYTKPRYSGGAWFFQICFVGFMFSTVTMSASNRRHGQRYRYH